MILHTALDWLLLPPGGPLALILLGLLLGRRAAGRWLAGTGLVVMYLAVTPFFTNAAGFAVQHGTPLDMADAEAAGAIVVLAAGRDYYSPQYGGETVSPITLVRLRYAAHLQRHTGLPILPAGGNAGDDGPPLAALMQSSLRRDFSAVVPFIEARSANTHQNAQYSAAVLAEHDIQRVLVVTHALHMPRALAAFAGTDLEAIPAPTALVAPPEADWPQFVPSAEALRTGRYICYELLGRAWYALRY